MLGGICHLGRLWGGLRVCRYLDLAFSWPATDGRLAHNSSDLLNLGTFNLSYHKCGKCLFSTPPVWAEVEQLTDPGLSSRALRENVDSSVPVVDLVLCPSAMATNAKYVRGRVLP